VPSATRRDARYRAGAGVDGSKLTLRLVVALVDCDEIGADGPSNFLVEVELNVVCADTGSSRQRPLPPLRASQKPDSVHA